MTEETKIHRQQGDALLPAMFDDLWIGQQVAATYIGPVAESYPSQGTAGSIIILEEFPGDEGQLLCLILEGCNSDSSGSQ